VAELTDAELEAEAALRRKARERQASRAGAPSAAATPVTKASVASTPQAALDPLPPGRVLLRRELEQYLANLELQPGVTLDTVREQYFKLRERYDPKKQASEEKRKVAQSLVDRLMRAYEAVTAHYEAKGET
jgi:flagellar basal body rod protein FlgC